MSKRSKRRPPTFNERESLLLLLLVMTLAPAVHALPAADVAPARIGQHVAPLA